MHDTKERLSILRLFALLNYLYADVIGLWAMAGARFPDFRAASGRVGQAARFCRVHVLRNDRDSVHVGHHLAGVGLVWR